MTVWSSRNDRRAADVAAGVDWGSESWLWVRESPFAAAVCDGSAIAGQCETVNGLWAAHALVEGLASGAVLLDCFARAGGTAVEGTAHTVAVLDGMVWDWTHRQFDEDADVPVVTPLAEWEQWWRSGACESLDVQRAAELVGEWERW